MVKQKLFFISYLCLISVSVVNTDLFNAVSDLEYLLVNEQQTVSLLENYIEIETENILQLKK